jgi:hypothetical protein
VRSFACNLGGVRALSWDCEALNTSGQPQLALRKLLELPELPKVARFSKTMDWGLVQKCGHDMRAGDSSAVMGSKKQCGEGCEWRPKVDDLLIPTL